MICKYCNDNVMFFTTTKCCNNEICKKCRELGNDDFCYKCGNDKFRPCFNKQNIQLNNQGFSQLNNQATDPRLYQLDNQGFNQIDNQGFNQLNNQGFNQIGNQGFNNFK
jgi:hypothetical protein